MYYYSVYTYGQTISRSSLLFTNVKPVSVTTDKVLAHWANSSGPHVRKLTARTRVVITGKEKLTLIFIFEKQKIANAIFLKSII